MTARGLRVETETSFVDIPLPVRAEPLVLAWPSAQRLDGLLQFDRPETWQAFVDSLGINLGIPDIVRRKYARAQKLYLLGWIDADLIKAGELVALTALELAVMDRYGNQYPKKKRTFASLLNHMVEVDGLTDPHIPMIARYGGSAIGQLTGEVKPTLAQRRNGMAHGDPFDGQPVGGLLELVRDLIDYAYRGFIAEWSGQGAPIGLA